jgi:hypothetical protein
MMLNLRGVMMSMPQQQRSWYEHGFAESFLGLSVQRVFVGGCQRSAGYDGHQYYSDYFSGVRSSFQQFLKRVGETTKVRTLW